MKKYFYWFGITAPILYIGAVIIGGALIPNYSHINQAISEIEPLMSKDNRFIISILFCLYNLLALLYGITMFLIFKDRGTKYKIQSLSITIISLSGLIMYFFPMDVLGSEVTLAGIIHIIIAGIMAPLTIITCFLGFHTFEYKKMKIYSLITSIVVIICGGLSAYLTTNGMALMGLFERFTIGSYIIWLMITGLYYKKNRHE